MKQLPFKSKEQVLTLLTAIVFLVGCSTVQLSPSQLEKATAYGSEVFSGCPECPTYQLLPYGSKGEKTDALVMHTKAVTGHPSVPAEQLAKALSSASTNAVCIIVTGVSSKFTAAIAIEALSLSNKSDLPGLRFLFVGDAENQQALRQAVAARGGVFFFRPE